MDLAYTFDPERFYLGTLCKRGHKWPGTEQSLRRLLYSKQGWKTSQCVACTGAKTRNWLLSFLDTSAMGLADNERLGPVCKGGHLWHGHQLTLRVNGDCLACRRRRDRNRERKLTPEQLEKKRAQARASYARRPYDPELYRERNRAAQKRIKARMATDPEFAEHIRQQRRRHKEQARRRRGQVPQEIRRLRRAINQAGRLPSVARLVAMEQWRYWREHPEIKDTEIKERERQRRLLRYKVDREFRLKEREKRSRRRAARFFAGIAYRVSTDQINQRFHRFDHCCAYCGASGDMQIEHVKPISQGGLHHISNIVPACLSCNYAKHADPMERWYRSQPFFDPARLALIQSLTGSPETEQLSLGLAC
jgi:5-methylcytosine-specific restriction endonuclease McrA